ncbi:metallophosphoesterase family protein [Thermococcus sp.]
MRFKLPSLFRRKKLPEALTSTEERKIMHLSDTPDNIYPFILNLIEKTRPDYIVHTGDLADNFKIERRPELKDKYAASVEILLRILENSKSEVYIVPGNEDDVEILRELVKRAHITAPGSIIEIGGLKLAVGHSYRDVIGAKNVDFKLYGHNFKSIPRGLNGVLNINFILLPIKRIIKLRYPSGTDFERGYKLMRGL